MDELSSEAKDLEGADRGSVNLEELDFDERDTGESEPVDDDVQASELNHLDMDELSSDRDLDEADEVDGADEGGSDLDTLSLHDLDGDADASDEIADGGASMGDALSVDDETSASDEIAGGGTPMEETLPVEGDEDDRVPEYFEPEGIMLVQNSRAPETETVQVAEGKDAEPAVQETSESVQPERVEPVAQDESEPAQPEQAEPAVQEASEAVHPERVEPITQDGSELAQTEHEELAPKDESELVQPEHVEPAVQQEVKFTAEQQSDPTVQQEIQPAAEQTGEPVAQGETGPEQLEHVEPIARDESEPEQTGQAELVAQEASEPVQPECVESIARDESEPAKPEVRRNEEPTNEDRISVQSMETSGIVARDAENGKNEMQVDIRDEAAVHKAYRNELLYANPDNRTFDKQLANLEERQKDLEGQIGRLEEKADQMKKEGKEDSKEYKNTNKALDKAKSDLDENKTQQNLICDTISDVKETEGLKRAEQIAEQGKKDAPLKLDETYAKRSERYLENARDVVKDKIEALEKERKTLGPEGKERRAQIDDELNTAKKNLVKLEYSLAGVKEAIVAEEMKEIKAITNKIDKAKGARAERLKEKYITPAFQARVERTAQRRKDAEALARSVEKAEYIPPKVDNQDDSVEIANKNKFVEKQKIAGQLATRMLNEKKMIDQVRETAMSYTPKMENDEGAKKLSAIYDFAMADAKVIKNALYDPKQVVDSVKEMMDTAAEARESINDETSLVNEKQKKDNETLNDLEEGLREAEAGDSFKLSMVVSDITLDTIASSKGGGILNLETDRDRSYFEKFRECQKSAVELYQSAKDLAGSMVNPRKWPEVVKNLAQMTDKVFNVEDKAKAWIGTLLEDRYGKNYGADTDFASKFDRSLYEWVSRSDSKFERFVHYAATTSDALAGMGEQYKKFL